MTYDTPKLTPYALRLIELSEMGCAPKTVVTPDEKARLDRIERRAIQKEEYELYKRPAVRKRRMGRIS